MRVTNVAFAQIVRTWDVLYEVNLNPTVRSSSRNTYTFMKLCEDTEGKTPEAVATLFAKFLASKGIAMGDKKYRNFPANPYPYKMVKHQGRECQSIACLRELNLCTLG